VVGCVDSTRDRGGSSDSVGGGRNAARARQGYVATPRSTRRRALQPPGIPRKFPRTTDKASRIGNRSRIRLTLVRRSNITGASQRELLSFRSPPWAFPPLTWAAGFRRPLFFRRRNEKTSLKQRPAAARPASRHRCRRR